MTFSSMTGFARADGAADGVRWQWELRSVNSRGLDVRVRLPSGYERLEPAARAQVSQRLERGNCSLSLSIQRDAHAGTLKINEIALEAVIAAANTLVDRAGAAPPSADGLLALRGVVEVEDAEADEEARAAIDAALLDTLGSALNQLVEMRRGEGARLADILSGQVDRIADLVDEAEVAPGRSSDVIARRLSEQVAQIMAASSSLDPARLHQEAALLATKADIREELDRLRAHVAAARELIGKGRAVGRRLDFLSQEFNREANTICSKSNDIALTRIGLEMKAVVDQIREQVQNVE